MTKKDIQKIIDAVIALRNTATDEQATTVQDLYPEWTEGHEYCCGDRVRYDGMLYKISKDHVAVKKPNEDDVYVKIL